VSAEISMRRGALDREVARNLTVAALGVVYGDIGTSPLYAVRQSLLAFEDTSDHAILGALSLIFWSLVLVVTVKYVAVIMRADKSTWNLYARRPHMAEWLLSHPTTFSRPTSRGRITAPRKRCPS